MIENSYGFPIFEGEDKTDMNEYTEKVAKIMEELLNKYESPLSYMGTVETFEDLESLTDLVLGEIYLVLDESTMYVYSNNGWVEYSSNIDLTTLEKTIATTSTSLQNLEETVENNTISDTGWIEAELEDEVTGTETTYGGPPGIQYRKIGNHVFVRGSIVTAFTGDKIKLTEIPYTPSKIYYSLNPLSGKSISRIHIATDGCLYLEWVVTIADGSYCDTSSLTWIAVNIDYFIDEDTEVTTVDNLQNTVKTNTDDISSIKTTIAEIQEEQTMQNENIVTNANDINTLKANVKTNTSNIETIQAEQEEQNTKIANREYKHSYYTYKVEEDISSGTEITLPCSYIVGADNLVLYDFFGKRLIKDEHYSEVGDDGAESTTITLLFDVVYSEEYEKIFDIVVKEVDNE